MEKEKWSNRAWMRRRMSTISWDKMTDNISQWEHVCEYFTAGEIAGKSEECPCRLCVMLKEASHD